jgi:signal transduction histidine kinase
MKLKPNTTLMNQKRGLDQLFDLYSKQTNDYETLQKVLVLINLYNHSLCSIWEEYVLSDKTFRKYLSIAVQESLEKITYFSPQNKEDNELFREIVLSDKNAYKSKLVKAYKIFEEHFLGQQAEPDIVFEFLTDKLKVAGRGSSSFSYSSNFTLEVVVKEVLASTLYKENFNFLELGSGLGKLMSILIKDSRDKQILGIEINQQIYNIAKLYLNLFQKPFNLFNGDIYQEDLLNQDQEINCVFADIISPKRTDISKLIHRALDITREKAILVVPESFLFESSIDSRNLREHLIDSDLIEKVISIPIEANQPLTSIKTSIIILNKKKQNDLRDRIEFEEIDFPEKGLNMFTENATTRTITGSQVVPNSEVRQDGNYRLNANWYIKATLLNEDAEYVKLKDFCSIKTGRQQPKDTIVEHKTAIGLIQIRNLAPENQYPSLDVSQVDKWVELKENTRRPTIAEFDDILVAQVGNSLKPTLLKEEGFAISQNVLAIKVSKLKHILPEYLVHYLRSDEGKEQLKKHQTYSIFPRINKSSLEEFLIPLIPLEAQKDFIRKKQSEYITAKEAYFQKDKESFVNETASTLEHTLGNSLKVIEGQFKTIREFFNSKSGYDPILKPQTRPENHYKSSLSSTLNRIESELMSAKFSLENVNDWRYVSKENLNLKLVKLKSFLEMILDETREGTNVKVLIDCPVNLEQLIDKERFKILLRNFFNNARKHSFITSETQIFEVSVKKERDNKTITIFIKNSGKPLDQDFELEKYTRSGTNKGMKLINNIVLAHSGTLTAIPSKYAQNYGRSVVFQIILKPF